MSLSNTPADEFIPLTVHSLDAFNDEVSNANKDTQPDFDRFTLLIEKPKFGQENISVFEALYKPPEEIEEVIFKPLIEKRIKNETKALDINTPDREQRSEPEPEPIEAPDEIGYREGFERGLADGEKKGYDQGFEKGLAEGDAKGYESGEAKGIEQGEQKGFEQGVRQGEAQGMEEARKQAQEIINSLEDALNKSDQTLEKLVDVYETKIIELIQKIAQKAVMAQVEINDEIVKSLVIDALKNLVEPEQVVLSVSTEDYEYIEMVKDQFFEQIESLKRVSVRSDPAVMRGGCRIETNTATVSTDPESRLNAIFDAMKSTGAL